MDTRQYFMKYIIPIIVVFLAAILVMKNYYSSELSLLEERQNKQLRLNDSLSLKNKELVSENERLKLDTCQHIRLDVTGVSHKGGGVVVNNSMCK